MSINIDELKKNPVFNMSLSGKEIFHSNVLAWLLSETDDNGVEEDDDNGEPTQTAKNLSELFPPKDKKEGEQYRVLTVFREKNDFDLLVLYLEEDDYKKFKEARKNVPDDAKINIEDTTDEIKFDSDKKDILEKQMDCLAKCKFVVIENKFKAIPDSEQLDRYYFEICGYKKNRNNDWHNKNNINLVNISNVKFANNGKIQVNEGNTTCYLLAPQEALNLFRNNSKKYTNKKEFDYKYTEKGKTLTKTKETLAIEWSFVSYNDLIEKIVPVGNNKFILEKYKSFTRQMLELSTEAVNVDENTELYAFEETVKSLKSIRIHDFYEKLWFSAVMSVIKQNLPKEINEGLSTEVGYTNGMGMLNFLYTFTDKKLNNAKYGIEIQGKQFRLFVYTNKKDEWSLDKTGNKIPENQKYEKIFHWLRSLIPNSNQISKIVCNAKGELEYTITDKEELRLGKFNEFKHIKFSLDPHISIRTLTQKIIEFLGIMKNNENSFDATIKSNKK